jgi:hypothetical protein
LVLAALLLLDSVGARPESARITVGDAVPVIKLSDREGQPVKVPDLKGSFNGAAAGPSSVHHSSDKLRAGWARLTLMHPSSLIAHR